MVVEKGVRACFHRVREVVQNSAPDSFVFPQAFGKLWCHQTQGVRDFSFPGTSWRCPGGSGRVVHPGNLYFTTSGHAAVETNCKSAIRCFPDTLSRAPGHLRPCGTGP
jgi:hypothetical protein